MVEKKKSKIQMTKSKKIKVKKEELAIEPVKLEEKPKEIHVHEQKDVHKEAQKLEHKPEHKPRVEHKPKKEKQIEYRGTGRRKTAIACAKLFPGNGVILVNNRSLKEYLQGRPVLEKEVYRPFEVTNNVGKFNVEIDAYGGGFCSQATAMSLGIARALVVMNPELKTILRKEGLLTRDPRAKERKKYGLKRARKAFQFSKR